MLSLVRVRQTRSFRVSYANIQAPPVVVLESYRRFVPQPAINCTVSSAPQHRHPALRCYHAHSASVCRTVFASVAHRAACQACLCLAIPWLVPGSERAWSALGHDVEDVDVRARGLSPVVQSDCARSFHIQAVATIFLGACFRGLSRLGSVLYRYVRTSAAFAAASLGDDPLGPCELDPSVRPPVGADALFAVPFFCAGAAGAEPTARPSPLKFLSDDGLPKQLPMVRGSVRGKCIEMCIRRVGRVDLLRG